MRTRSFLAGATAVLVGMSLFGTEPVLAQIGSGGTAIGAGGTSTPGVTARGQRPARTGASAPIQGPFQPRMPLLPADTQRDSSKRGDLNNTGQPGASNGPAVESQAYGTFNWPYSTARVAVTQMGPSPGPAQTPVTSRPFRQTGKLYARWGTSWFVCTASLIKRSVLVTATHCVYDYGTGPAGHADEVLWVPANFRELHLGGGPWGYFEAVDWFIPTVQAQGTDTCEVDGIVCNNDVAVVVMRLKDGQHASQILGGVYGYAWNGFAFTQSPDFANHTVAAITQLGYPAAIDNGLQMQRNDSFGKYYATNSTTNGQQMRNVELGSAMTGGSSGGPWLVNFGTRPTITPTPSGTATLGSQSGSNAVMAVTSWGYNNVNINVQGASWFGQNYEFPLADYGGHGAGNIGALVNAACTTYPGRC